MVVTLAVEVAVVQRPEILEVLLEQMVVVGLAHLVGLVPMVLLTLAEAEAEVTQLVVMVVQV
tara:strand:+ start:262 stop:447 length:186 start_codon:yes stop_codon:yes gene_type:complete